MGSILNTIKKMLSIPPETTDFDPELIVFINSALSTLSQIGVDMPNHISGPEEEWGVLAESSKYSDIKTYVYLKVRMMFDPPTISIVSNSFKDQLTEIEWRLNVKRDNDLKGIL